MRTPLLRKPNPETLYAKKIYRYNEQNETTISLSEIEIQKVHNNERTRTVRHEIHRGVYPKSSVQLPDAMTVGKLYTCTRSNGALSLVVYRAKRGKKKLHSRTILIVLGYTGIFLFGLLFIILLNYQFAQEAMKKDVVICSIGFFTLGVICFAIGKTMEHKQHTQEREINTSIEALGTEVAQ